MHYCNDESRLQHPGAQNRVVAVALRMIYNLCTDAIAILG
ncbi:hypothetical protein ABIE91_000685 [Bradyrhizobium elkanii]